MVGGKDQCHVKLKEMMKMVSSRDSSRGMLVLANVLGFWRKGE